MKLIDLKKDFYYFTGEVTKLVRNMSFSGIAIVWILKKTDNESIILDDALLIVLTFFAGALMFDFIQYLYQAICWSIYYRCEENKGLDPEKEFFVSSNFNIPSWILYSLKIVLLIIGYVYLIIYLFNYLLEKV